MIIKNLTRKNNSGQLIKYVLRYVLADEKQTTKPFIIRHNIRSRSLNGYIHEFAANELNRVHKRSHQTALHHTILSWSDKDAKHVTDAMLTDIGKQYIKLRGDNNLYLGTVHKDRNHTHIHLVVSGTELNGKASRISKERFAEIKKTLNAYQKDTYPELSHSFPQHGKKKEAVVSIERAVNLNIRSTKKRQLARDLEEIKLKAKSSNEFISLLQLKSYEPYFRGTDKVLTGLKYGGVKYRFKTLGYDAKELNDHYLNVTKEENEMTKIKQLRNRNLERDQLKDRIKGHGEVSPYMAFNQEELSYTR